MHRKVEPEVKNIIDKYLYTEKFKYYSNKYYPSENSVFLSIQSKEDVAIAEQCIVNLLKAYSDIIVLPCDIDELEKAFGIYEIAVRKVFLCYNNTDFDFDYSANQLQSLINKVRFYDSEVIALSKKMFRQTYNIY
jgi:hypothetical protein